MNLQKIEIKQEMTDLVPSDIQQTIHAFMSYKLFSGYTKYKRKWLLFLKPSLNHYVSTTGHSNSKCW